MKKHTFTLVELLTVIGIIIVLAGILLPSITSARKKSVEASCARNMAQIGQGFSMFSADNKQYIVQSEKRIVKSETEHEDYTWVEEVYDYIKSPEVFVCDADERNEDDKFGVTTDNGDKVYPSYVTNSGMHLPKYCKATGKRYTKSIKLYDVGSPVTTISLASTQVKKDDTSLDDYRWGVDIINDNYDTAATAKKTIDDTCELDNHVKGTNFLFADLHVQKYSRDDILKNIGDKWIGNNGIDKRNKRGYWATWCPFRVE